MRRSRLGNPRPHWLLPGSIAVLAAVLVGVLLTIRSGPPATVSSATGTLVTVERSGRDLTLRTGGADRHFVVDGDTLIHDGTRLLAPDDLTAARGCAAKIRYLAGATRPSAEDVRISCDTHASP